MITPDLHYALYSGNFLGRASRRVASPPANKKLIKTALVSASTYPRISRADTAPTSNAIMYVLYPSICLSIPVQVYQIECITSIKIRMGQQMFASLMVHICYLPVPPLEVLQIWQHTLFEVVLTSYDYSFGAIHRCS